MPPRPTKRNEQEEALALSRQKGAALQEPEGDDEDEMNEGESGEFQAQPPPYSTMSGLDGDDEDDDLRDLNNPDVSTFGEPPLIGAQGGTSDLFGSEARTIGRATSPKLYAQASQFPSAVQFRVWRWENGIPVALGAIDSEATEEDFVNRFYDAMPKDGDGRFQFRFRPVDMRGQELGKEFTLNISEHHAELQRIRRQKDRNKTEESRPVIPDPILINQGGDGGGTAYAEEMGRMFEQAVEAAERRTELLQATLEEERARLREEEKAKYQERISLASQSAEVVQKMTERMLETDRQRAQEQLKAQESQSGLLMNTLTAVFAQQQSAERSQAERMREADEQRMRQDREFFERQRQEEIARRDRDRLELEAQRAREREEWERKRLLEKEEAERRIAIERDRIALEQKRIEEQRRFELEQLRLEAEKREKEAERRRELEKEELKVRLERERMEMERQRQAAVEERERWRAEMEDKRRAEREEWERKRLMEKEDAERRERAERERIDRERAEMTLRLERERTEREDVLRRRQEELEREERKRKEETELRLKQIEIEAQRAREHQERMAEQARLDREAQREAQERRDRIEREAREAADRDRQRQHEMQLREMEAAQQRDREHQERMLAHQRSLSGGGGEGGGLMGILDSLGMDAPEVLERIFGGGNKDGEDGGGWADAIPKVLGSIAEIGKAAITANAEKQKQIQQHGRRRLPQLPGGQPQMVQTPQGPMIVVPGGTVGTGANTVITEPGLASVPEGREWQVARERVRADAQALAQAERAALQKQKAGEQESKETGPTRSDSAVPDEGEPINLLARARKAGLSLGSQKKARKAILTLAEKLAESPEDEWAGVLTEAISSEINIFHYIKAVTVQAALDEATDDTDLKTRVVAALKNSGMVPDDVPYDETDYARLAGKKEKK